MAEYAACTQGTKDSRVARHVLSTNSEQLLDSLLVWMNNLGSE